MPRFKVYKKIHHNSRLASIGNSAQVVERVYIPYRQAEPLFATQTPKQLTLF